MFFSGCVVRDRKLVSIEGRCVTGQALWALHKNTYTIRYIRFIHTILELRKKRHYFPALPSN